jgi:hypothetical protein
LKNRIDDAVIRKDCKSLQSEFDIADRNNELQQKRTGKNNADLLAYLDEKMRLCGCY